MCCGPWASGFGPSSDWPDRAGRMELALELHQAGRLAEAEAAYRAVLANDPDNVDALHFLGVLAFQRNDYRKAEELIARSLARNPANPAARNNLGNALAAQARLDEAMACYREALTLQPGFVGALVNLGAGSMAQGKAEEAVGYYAQALDIEPGNAMALSNLGNAYRQQERHEDAAACHAKAIALDPDMPEAQHNFGNSLHDLGRLDEAEARYRKALSLRPGFAEALTSLGNVLDNRGRIDEAQQCHRDALALKPDFADAHCNLGNTLVAQGRLQEAQACFEQALRQRPGLAPATFSLANLRLMLGDYAAGLPLYECRFDKQALSRLYAGMRARLAQLEAVPRWRGEDAAGKTLLVWTEQGLGDSLMLLRYLPLLKQRGVGRLLVHCEPALARLVRDIAGVDGVIPKSEAPPLAELHLHCPIMSLPLAFNTRLATIPARVPYVRVTADLGRAWAGKLSGVGRPRVGLVWSGGDLYPRNTLRSVRLAQLGPILEVAGVSFVSLQKGETARQRRDSAVAILDWMAECDDLLETAALIRQLDLVICVDTSVAHLAGALGAPVWMLNRFESEWRWQLRGEDSPWYPTMRIFRQTRPGDWDEVIARVAAELRHRTTLELGNG